MRRLCLVLVLPWGIVHSTDTIFSQKKTRGAFAEKPILPGEDQFATGVGLDTTTKAYWKRFGDKDGGASQGTDAKFIDGESRRGGVNSSYFHHRKLRFISSKTRPGVKTARLGSVGNTDAHLRHVTDELSDDQASRLHSVAPAGLETQRGLLFNHGGSPLHSRGVASVIRYVGDCLPDENGSYGTQEGDEASVFFFYQVEASEGVTETQVNGIIIDDIEIALMGFMIPMFFSECYVSATSTLTTKAGSAVYVGATSKPADFVLRGFDCTEKATEPCFVVSGSMTVHTIGMTRAAAQAQMRVAIFRIMKSGVLAAAVSRVNAVALLDDSLNVLTFPTEAPALQFTRPVPSTTTTKPTPTWAPTSDMPTNAPTSGAYALTQPPTHIPLPTLFTSHPPVTPTMARPSLAPALTPTQLSSSPSVTPSANVTENEITTTDPSTHEPKSSPTQQQTRVPTAYVQNTTLPVTSTDETPPVVQRPAGPVPEASGRPTTLSSVASSQDASLDTTLPPTVLQTGGDPLVITNESHKSAFEKVPVWAWILLAVALCICCSCADPDADDDESGVHQRLREQEHRILANPNEHDKDRDAMHDSEAFSSGEYVRKLYRQ